MTNESNNQIKGWPAMSVVKFVCVVAMIWVHAHMALISDGRFILSTKTFFYRVTSDFMFIGLFLYILPVIAGVVLRMDLGGRVVNEKIGGDDFKRILWSAIWLVLAGFFMSTITWGFYVTFSWNVLQLIALSFLAIAFLLKEFSVRAVWWLGLGAILLAAPLRELWGSYDYIYPVGVFIGANDGFILWPFFPWFGVVAFGFLTAHYYLKFKDSLKFRMSLLVVGTSFLLIALLRNEFSPYLDPDFVWGPSLFQPGLGLVLAALGLFCLLVVLANTLFNKSRFRRYGIINSYSKGILWIYVVQMFASQKLAPVIKSYWPMGQPTLAYFILPVGLLILSWLVGTLSIKLLQEKSIVIRLRKVK